MHSPSTDASPSETFRFRLPGKQTITGLTFQSRRCPKYKKGLLSSMARFSQFSGSPVHHAVFRLTLANTGVCKFERKSNESSNPIRSASKSKLQRNCPAFWRENMENMPVFRNISSAKRTGENGLPGIEWRQSTGLSLEGTLAVRFQ